MSCLGIDSEDAGGQDALTARLATSGALYHNEPFDLSHDSRFGPSLDLELFIILILFIRFSSMASFMLYVAGD